MPVTITPLWIYAYATDSQLHQAVAAADLYNQKGWKEDKRSISLFHEHFEKKENYVEV